MVDDDDSPDDSDAHLFRREMAGTVPLRRNNKVQPPHPKPRPRARFSRADERRALEESLLADIDETELAGSDRLRYCRDSVGKRTMRKLARGRFSVQHEIDLHGMIVEEARQALRDFIELCCQRGYGCVRVIHGKGLGSGARGPILKHKVNRWLQQWDDVLAYSSTRQVDGGTGALYVLLKKR